MDDDDDDDDDDCARGGGTLWVAVRWVLFRFLPSSLSLSLLSSWLVNGTSLSSFRASLGLIFTSSSSSSSTFRSFLPSADATSGGDFVAIAVVVVRRRFVVFMEPPPILIECATCRVLLSLYMLRYSWRARRLLEFVVDCWCCVDVSFRQRAGDCCF